MMLLGMYLIIISTIPMMLMLIPLYLGMLMKSWSQKLSSFECGMNLNSNQRKPFSIRFFLLMILFIIFDIEIALIIILPVLFPSMTLQSEIFTYMFTMILFSGLIYEWNEGSLNWKL